MYWNAYSIRPTLPVLLLLVVFLAFIAACTPSTSADPSLPTATPQPKNTPQPVTLRLGYFPNVTHAQPIVGLARGTFSQVLGDTVILKATTFNAGPSAIEALFAGAIDATYIGPNPAISGYVQSGGKALRIVVGATSGGALLVVRPDRNIKMAADLANKKLATPQLGNTQDVALRAYLQANGLASKENGGNVQVIPTSNANILTAFLKGDIDGAWVPEPWGSRLVNEAQGQVFLDERTLWPNGDFVTTHLIVRTEFLEKNPEVVERLLQAHVETTQWIQDNQTEASRIVSKGIGDVTGVALPVELVAASWKNLRITYDPVASSLARSADDAFRLGFLGSSKPDLSTIYNLDPLNKVLAAKGLPKVSR